MHNKAKPWIGNGLNGKYSTKSKKARSKSWCIFIQLLRQFRAHVHFNVFLLRFAVLSAAKNPSNQILATSDCLHFFTVCQK